MKKQYKGEYIAVNTFNQVDGWSPIISGHRSYAAAAEACNRIQPKDGYIPTSVFYLPEIEGHWARPSEHQQRLIDGEVI